MLVLNPNTSLRCRACLALIFSTLKNLTFHLNNLIT
ncbi:hypothetical protein LINPERHAP2_LOCUS9563 [Linum perenne]